MTQPLSPAAQAVYEAWIYPARFPIGKTSKYARGSLAAALRAAAGRTEADSIWRGHSEHTGVRWAAEQWRAIAAELEGSA